MGARTRRRGAGRLLLLVRARRQTNERWPRGERVRRRGCGAAHTCAGRRARSDHLHLARGLFIVAAVPHREPLRELRTPVPSQAPQHAGERSADAAAAQLGARAPLHPPRRRGCRRFGGLLRAAPHGELEGRLARVLAARHRSVDQRGALDRRAEAARGRAAVRLHARPRRLRGAAAPVDAERRDPSPADALARPGKSHTPTLPICHTPHSSHVSPDSFFLGAAPSRALRDWTDAARAGGGREAATGAPARGAPRRPPPHRHRRRRCHLQAPANHFARSVR